LRLRPSEKTDGWRLDHDPRANLIGMDFESATVGLDAFAAQHARLSTAPDSPFVRLASAFRRKSSSVVVLRSVGLSETYADRVDNTTIDNPTASFAVPAAEFHPPLPHLTQADRNHLWRRAWSQYQAFLAKTTASQGPA